MSPTSRALTDGFDPLPMTQKVEPSSSAGREDGWQDGSLMTTDCARPNAR
jgi:hypothetical protein